MADIFNKPDVTIVNPFTADLCVVKIDDKEGYATQVQIQYTQQITRRRTIGGQKFAVMYGAMPQGQLSMARLGITGMNDIYNTPTFKGCGGGEVSVELKTCDGDEQHFTLKGCMVSSYSITIEAEGLTVMDNVVIDFIEMTDE